MVSAQPPAENVMFNIISIYKHECFYGLPVILCAAKWEVKFEA